VLFSSARTTRSPIAGKQDNIVGDPIVPCAHRRGLPDAGYVVQPLRMRIAAS
jgi:hypothetical protein